MMGCYPSNPDAPKFILVEREHEDDEPTVEDFDYESADSLIYEAERRDTRSSKVGYFKAVYQLITETHITTSVQSSTSKVKNNGKM